MWVTERGGRETRQRNVVDRQRIEDRDCGCQETPMSDHIAVRYANGALQARPLWDTSAGSFGVEPGPQVLALPGLAGPNSGRVGDAPDNLLDRATQLGLYITDQLNQTAQSLPAIKEVRGAGLFIGIELNPQGAWFNDAADIVNKCMDQGLLIPGHYFVA